MIRHAIIIITLLLSALGVSAQQAIHIYHDGKKDADVMLNCQIDSIYFTTEGKELRQVFATAKEKKSYPVTSIDSIKFQGEFMKVLGQKNITVPYSGYAVIYGKILCNDDRYIYSLLTHTKESGDGVYDYKHVMHNMSTLFDVDEKSDTIVFTSNNAELNYTSPLSDTIYITQLSVKPTFIKEPGHLWINFSEQNHLDDYFTNRVIDSFIILPPDSQSIDIKVNPLVEGTLEFAPEVISGDFWSFNKPDEKEWFSSHRKNQDTLTINVSENTGALRWQFYR